MLALTRLSVAKPLAVIAIFIAVAVAGFLSYRSLAALAIGLAALATHS